MKVLVCSASLDALNHNNLLRNHLARGFEEFLDSNSVLETSLDGAVNIAKIFHPDLIVVFGSCMPESSNFLELRGYCSRSSSALVFWLHDDPYEFDFNPKIYKYADFIFSNDRWATTHIAHPKVFHLPLAADPKTHFREIGSSMERDLFFCGVGFDNRIQLLRDFSNSLKPYNVEVFGDMWPIDINFCKNKRINNLEISDLYQKSLITLNLGRVFNLANRRYMLDPTTPGPRTFEAAMSGAVQSIQYLTPEISEYYEIDSEILVFDTAADLIQQLKKMKNSPNIRREIAIRSQKRTLEFHTYKNRAEKIIKKVFNE